MFNTLFNKKIHYSTKIRYGIISVWCNGCHLSEMTGLFTYSDQSFEARAFQFWHLDAIPHSGKWTKWASWRKHDYRSGSLNAIITENTFQSVRVPDSEA